MARKFTIWACLASFLVGYYYGVLNNMRDIISDNLSISNNTADRLIILQNVYSAVGSVLGGLVSDFYGRREALTFVGLSFCIGATTTCLAFKFPVFIIGQIFLGITIGLGSVIAPTYTTEIAPRAKRGLFTTFHEVFFNMGIFFSFLTNFVFTGIIAKVRWHVMMGVGVIPSIILVRLSTKILPESPRWLIMQGRIADAAGVLRRTLDADDVEQTLIDLKAANGIVAEEARPVVPIPIEMTSKIRWIELFASSAAISRTTMIVLGLHFINQITEIDSFTLWSGIFIGMIDSHIYEQQVLVSMVLVLVKTFFLLLPLYLLDSVGRRPMMLCSLGCMIFSMGCLGFGITFLHPSGVWATITAFTFFISVFGSFSIGIGPMAWVYSCEILPSRLRSQGLSAGVVVNRIISCTLSEQIIGLSHKIGERYVHLMYAGVSVFGWLFCFQYMDETGQGRGLEHIEDQRGTGPDVVV